MPTIAPAPDGTAVLPITQVSPALPIRGTHILKPCALAALVAWVLFLMGLNLLMATIGAGFLSVVFSRQFFAGSAPKAIAGAGIGALGGLVFFGFGATVIAIGSAFPEARLKGHEWLIDYMQKIAAARPPEPQIQQFLDQLKTPEGFAVTVILFGIFFLILFPMVGSLGGAIAGALFGRRTRS